VKYAIPALVVSLLIAAGCQQQPKPATTDSAALDVTPAPAPAPAPISQVAYASPAPMQSMTPDPALAPAAPAAGSASANTYTIRKGDTLWKIAATHYGDGKKWHEIADANPGLSPSSLRVGQSISLP